jgi:hypothetical protein
MEPELEQALQAVFGKIPEEKAITVTGRAGMEELSQVRDLLQQAEQALSQGKWEDFGQAMEKLKASLSPGPSK